ncbi:MAG: hypothetical protein COA33_008655 [Fluviicola sp.]|nr:hypothetical protein [Fluviicola sp.]
MALEYKINNIAKGGFIYAAGDTVAAVISDDFSWMRLLGIFLIGATVYAFEIPNYFKWIDKKVTGTPGLKTSMTRALMAMLYFNPLWIARHILFIMLVSGNFDAIGWGLLLTGVISFAINIPVSLGANYIIQNKIELKHRFLASAIFSGFMAVYYSLSAVWFA